MWSRSRKVWGALGAFKNHLNLYYPFGYDLRFRGNIVRDFYPETLIPRWGAFPYGGDECVVIEVDEAANTVKEYPAATWIWNNVYFPRYQRENERVQEQIRSALGIKGEVALAMLEPVHVEAVSQVGAFEPMTEQEIYNLVDTLPEDHTVIELARCIEESVRQRIVAQRSKL